MAPKAKAALLPFKVQPPFDSESHGDCIVRSSDGFDFRVWHSILSLASDVFCDMFSIPSAPEDKDTPVIQLHEDGQTLQTMLQILYPRDPPTVTSVSLMTKLLAAFDKYTISLSKLRIYMRDVVTSRAALDSDPLSCFAISWRLGMAEEAVQASRYTHRLNLSDPKVTTRIIILARDAIALSALWDLRTRRLDQLDDLLDVVKIDPSVHCTTEAHRWMHCELIEDRRTRKDQLKTSLEAPYPTFDDIEAVLGFSLRVALGRTVCPRCTEAKATQLKLIKLNALDMLRGYPQEITQ